MSIRDIITKPLAEVGNVTVDPMDEQIHIHQHTHTQMSIYVYAFTCTKASMCTEHTHRVRVRELYRFLITRVSKLVSIHQQYKYMKYLIDSYYCNQSEVTFDSYNFCNGTVSRRYAAVNERRSPKNTVYITSAQSCCCTH